MKVQTKLYTINALTFGLLSVIMMSIIAFVFYSRTKATVYGVLKNTTLISALFYLEEDEMNSAEFEGIKQRFEEEVFNQFYQFYDMNDSIQFGAQNPRLSAKRLNEIRKKEALAFTDGDFFCYAIFYRDNQGDFVVVTKEKKQIVDNQMYDLAYIMIGVFVLGTMVFIFVNRRIAANAYRPFRAVIDQVNELHINSPELKIEALKTKDELADLIDTFNKLLSQLDEILTIQQNFVRYVSHEFKTPLTSMMGDIEVFSLKDRTPEEYHNMAQNLIDDITYLEETLSTLMLLADKRNIEDKKEVFRIDDIVWEIIEKLEIKYRKDKISIRLDFAQDIEHLLTVNVNYRQVFLALYNIMDNGLKYSDNKKLQLYFDKNVNQKLSIEIKDFGRGIPQSEIDNITKPFFRASNVQTIPGTGIGLTLSKTLLEKNYIKFSIKSTIEQGTIVKLDF